MDEEHVNLLEEVKGSNSPGKKRPFFLFNKVFLSILIVVALIGVFFSTTTATNDESGLSRPSFFSTLKSLVVSGDKSLIGEDGDRINFLLLGHGGAGHDGPELTDTIIFASLQPSERKVGMLSIPRDLTIPIPGYGWRKINHVNAYGEQDDPGKGAQIAASAIGEILEQDIHYWIKVDFRGFEKLIDAIGGVTVYIDRSFTDPAYPIDDGEGSITTLEFEEGWQDMDGVTALQYVRSRHGNNGEGSDFARAARQQKVLMAVKKKVFSASTLLNPGRIGRIIDTLQSHIDTNLTTWEIIRIANMGDLFDGDSVNSLVLDTRPGGPLYETHSNGAYVILPKNNDWSPIQQLASNIFDADDIFVTNATNPDIPSVRVEIQNGTKVTGLASQTAQLLQSLGFEVTQVGNAETKDFAQTIIYDLSEGKHSAELKAIQEYLDAEVQLSAPGWIFTNDIVPDKLTVTSDVAKAQSTVESIDFLIILGQSSANLARS